MRFIKAFSSALGGTFVNKWKDFYGSRPGVFAIAGIFQAASKGRNANRGENIKDLEKKELLDAGIKKSIIGDLTYAKWL